MHPWNSLLLGPENISVLSRPLSPQALCQQLGLCLALGQNGFQLMCFLLSVPRSRFVSSSLESGPDK